MKVRAERPETARMLEHDRPLLARILRQAVTSPKISPCRRRRRRPLLRWRSRARNRKAEARPLRPFCRTHRQGEKQQPRQSHGEEERRLVGARDSPTMQRTAILLAAAIFTFSAPSADGAARPSQNACEREMTRAAKRYDIPLGVLYAVGLTETGKRGSLQPYRDEHRRSGALLGEPRGSGCRLPGSARRRRGADRCRLHADQPPLSRRSLRLCRGHVRSRAATSTMPRAS